LKHLKNFEKIDVSGILYRLKRESTMVKIQTNKVTLHKKRKYEKS